MGMASHMIATGGPSWTWAGQGGRKQTLASTEHPMASAGAGE